jgi:hypothetical protein
MTTRNDKRKLAKRRKRTRNRRVRRDFNMKLDDAIKSRFQKATSTGRKATMTDVVQELMNAYSEAVERDGRQPEFPLEVRSKVTLPE